MAHEFFHYGNERRRISSCISVSSEEFGVPTNSKLDQAAKRARDAASYSAQISQHAIDRGCLSQPSASYEIPRMKDGKLTPCYMHFTMQYAQQYQEAVEEIAKG